MAIIDPSSSRQSGRNQLVFWGLLAMAVVAMIWIRHGARPRNQGRNHPAAGRELPAWKLTALTGTATDTDLKSLRGSVVLINFWGTWCPPCRVELPHMAQLRRDFASRQDFRLLAVSCPLPDDPQSLADLPDDTRRFLAAKKIDLPTYADPNGTTRKAVGMVLGERNLDIPGYPTTVLLDRAGIVRAVWVGYEDGLEKDMEQAIAEVLGKGEGRGEKSEGKSQK